MTKFMLENSGKSQLYELLYEWWHTADVCQSSDIVIRDLEERVRDLILQEEEMYIGDYGPSKDYVLGFNHYHELVKEKLEPQ